MVGGGLQLVDTGEVVARGCLARDTGDTLIAVMLGEKRSKATGTLRQTLMILFIPPLVAGVLYGLIPLKCPGLGVVGSRFAYLSFLPPLTAAPGLAFLMLHALNVKHTSRFTTAVIVFTLILPLIFSIAMYAIGKAWMFPIPFGFIVCASPSFGVGVFAIFYIIFEKAINRRLVRRLLPLIGVSVLPIVFSATFGFYRTLFSQVNAFQQTLLSPVWVLIKITMKKVATVLVDKGKNPDTAPYLMFCFDAVSAMAGNFLFLSTSSFWVVFVMIAMDVCENLMLGMRVVYFVFKSRRLAPEDRVTGAGGIKRSAQHSVVQVIESDTCFGRMERFFVRLFELLDFKRDKEVPVELMDDFDRTGQMNICLARAARLLLGFVASETSEMVTSCWSMIMLPLFYYGPNRAYMYTLDVFDDDAFYYAVLYSFTDFLLELITFSIMIYVFSSKLRINVKGVLTSYLDKKKLFLPVLAIGITITIASFTFFLKHFGMDPTFKWTEYQDIGGNMSVAGNETYVPGC